MAIRKKKNDNQFDNLTFEQSIASLTEIVNQIETGQVPLAESLEKYEKGMAIIRHCRQILLDAEKRIEEVAEDKSQCPPSQELTEEEEEEEETEDNEQEEDQNKDESLF